MEEKELLQFFGRGLLFLMDDATGIVIENQQDKKKYILFREGVNINVSSDNYEDIPEGIRLKISSEKPKTEE